MKPTDYFVWSVRAQRISSAIREGNLSAELLDYAAELLGVLICENRSCFATALRPVWFETLRRTPLQMDTLFGALSTRLLGELRSSDGCC